MVEDGLHPVAEEFVSGLKEYAFVHNPVEIGCTRQNVWLGNERSWSWLKGDLVLRSHPSVVMVPVDSVLPGAEVPTFESTDGIFALLWRAGPWKEWWVQDARETWAMVDKAILAPAPLGSLIVWENNRMLTGVVFEFASEEDPGLILEEIETRLGGWRKKMSTSPPPRIRKDSIRSAICYNCPVRRRCDAYDKLAGQQSDWSEEYWGSALA